jgi:histidine triad (HIT) family protein
MCLFCQIINGEESAEKIYEDDLCVVIKDKFPAAPIHLLVLPKKHIDSISTLEKEDQSLIGHLVLVAKKIAEQKKLPGYKLQWNVNKEGGQIIFHIHLHLMAD